MKAPLLSVGCFLAVVSPLTAGQREVVRGFVEPVDATDYDYLFRAGASRPAHLALGDELRRDAITQFSRARLEIVRHVSVAGGTPPDRLGVVPSGLSPGIALRRLPSELMWPGNLPLSPERWAGQSTGLHPNLREMHPFEVTAPGDFDQDGAPDAQDAFPANPQEFADEDNDGSGNNADGDDDNDGMPDTYETASGLDPYYDDASEDHDEDGFTNGEEAAAGTRAQDGDSFFHIKGSGPSERPGVLELRWLAQPGRSYQVWSHPDLAPRSAVLLEDTVKVTAPEIYTALVDATGPRDLYFIRVILDPIPNPPTP